MGWVLAALIVVVIGAALIAARGRMGELAPYVDDRPAPDLPADRPLAADDLRQVRFTVVTRGYSPPQVDALLARVSAEMAATTRAAASAEPEMAPARSPSSIEDAKSSGLGWPG